LLLLLLLLLLVLLLLSPQVELIMEKMPNLLQCASAPLVHTPQKKFGKDVQPADQQACDLPGQHERH
jgi:hypothetical protein